MEELMEDIDTIENSVEPSNFILSVSKLHEIDQKCQILHFYLTNSSTRADVEEGTWLSIVENDYLIAFTEKFNCFSPYIKFSILYCIDGLEGFVPPFIWEKDIETEMATYFNENQQFIRKDYYRIIQTFKRIKQKINQRIQNVDSNNFFETYQKIRKLDLQCVYYFDSIPILRTIPPKKYFQLMTVDFPKYVQDIKKELNSLF